MKKANADEAEQVTAELGRRREEAAAKGGGQVEASLRMECEAARGEADSLKRLLALAQQRVSTDTRTLRLPRSRPWMVGR